MESIAVAKVYARRHRYEVDANQELFGLGMANVASGFFGGFPVTGGFSRTAVSRFRRHQDRARLDRRGAAHHPGRAVPHPGLQTLPQAALGATIIVAVLNLVDIEEMRHIARVKRSAT